MHVTLKVVMFGRIRKIFFYLSCDSYLMHKENELLDKEDY